MSSLLQFSGDIKRGKVGLQFQLIKKQPYPDIPHLTREIDIDTFECSICGREHSNIYIAYRKPLGMFGCWVTFRYNNDIHVPDLSIPISIEKLPRDAVKMSQEDAEKLWHS